MWKKLISAIKFNNLDEIIEFLQEIPAETLAINKRSDSSTALQYAIKKGNIKACSLIINKLSSDQLTITDRLNNTALHISAQKNTLKVTKLLIEKMTPMAINLANTRDNTAFHYTYQKGDIDNLELIMNKCSEAIDTRGSSGDTVLFQAARNGNFNICKIILDKKPEAALFPTENGYFPLHSAVENGHLDICELILNTNPQTINSVIIKGKLFHKTPLYYAIKKNDIKFCMLVINNFSNALNVEGVNPLHYAAELGNKEMFELFLESFPKMLKAQDNLGYLPLHYAALEGHIEIIKLAIRYFPESLNFLNMYNFSPLQIATEKGHKEVIKLAIDHSPDEVKHINKKNGYTLLHFAAEHYQTKICESLVTAFPETVHSRTTNGKLPLDMGDYDTDMFNILALPLPNKEIYDYIDKGDANLQQLGASVENYINTTLPKLRADQVFSQNNIKFLHWYQIGYKYNFESQIKSIANNYIVTHYFKLIGICKDYINDNPILSLPIDMMHHILSFLEPYSLNPGGVIEKPANILALGETENDLPMD